MDSTNLTIFQTSDESIVVYKSTISRHIKNIFDCGELKQDMVVAFFATTTQHGAIHGKTQTHEVTFYNLDMIISVGYRVNSICGVRFRQWASRILKEYLLHGYIINKHMMFIEQRIDHQIQEHTEQIHELQEKVDFFVRTSLPPKEGVFYNGQIFDAYVFATDLIKSAKESITLIDNYIDAATFEILDVRQQGVTADIYSSNLHTNLCNAHNANASVAPINTHIWTTPSHDRWLIVDDDLYHCGHYIKDMGKKLSAIMQMGTSPDTILNAIK